MFLMHIRYNIVPWLLIATQDKNAVYHKLDWVGFELPSVIYCLLLVRPSHSHRMAPLLQLYRQTNMKNRKCKKVMNIGHS